MSDTLARDTADKLQLTGETRDEFSKLSDPEVLAVLVAAENLQDLHISDPEGYADTARKYPDLTKDGLSSPAFAIQRAMDASKSETYMRDGKERTEEMFRQAQELASREKYGQLTRARAAMDAHGIGAENLGTPTSSSELAAMATKATDFLIESDRAAKAAGAAPVPYDFGDSPMYQEGGHSQYYPPQTGGTPPHSAGTFSPPEEGRNRAAKPASWVDIAANRGGGRSGGIV